MDIIKQIDKFIANDGILTEQVILQFLINADYFGNRLWRANKELVAQYENELTPKA